jgi:hypothetical protein
VTTGPDWYTAQCAEARERAQAAVAANDLHDRFIRARFDLAEAEALWAEERQHRTTDFLRWQIATSLKTFGMLANGFAGMRMGLERRVR